jgi:hypothetical protein
MKLDCQITESLQRDFSALWKCQQRGDSLEITTPYLLPDSTLLSLFLTQREGRFIVCDGGGVFEVIDDYCPFPQGKAIAALQGYAHKFGLKQGVSEGKPLFFKDCTDVQLISSLAFDVATFATIATSALVASSEEIETEDRFKISADAYLKAIKPSGVTIETRHQIDEVPGVKFSAVLKGASRLWLVSYVTGSSITYFRRSLADTVMNFKHAWQSSLKDYIGRTIPLVNDQATGYRPSELGWQMGELAHESRNSVVRWTEHEKIAELLG